MRRRQCGGPNPIRPWLTLLLLILPRPAVSQQQPPPQEQLWDAAIQGDTAALAAALAHGAVVDSLDTRRSPNGRRALNWAAWYNQPVAIRFLVAHGATVNLPNRTGFTALHHAAENGSRDAAAALLQAGADPDWPNGAGLRPVEVARARGQEQVAALLDSVAQQH